MPRPCGECARCVHLHTLILHFPHDPRYRDVAGTAEGCRSPVYTPPPTTQSPDAPSPPPPAQAQPVDPHQPSPPSTLREPTSSPLPWVSSPPCIASRGLLQRTRKSTPSPASFPLLTLSPPLPPLEMRDLPEPPELEDDSDGEDGLPMLTQIMSQIREPVRRGGTKEKERDGGVTGRRGEDRKGEVKVKEEPEDGDDMYLDYPAEPDTQNPVHPSLSPRASPSPSPRRSRNPQHPYIAEDAEDSDSDSEEVDELLSSQPSPSPAKLPSSKARGKRKRSSSSSPFPGEDDNDDDNMGEDENDKKHDAKTKKKLKTSAPAGTSSRPSPSTTPHVPRTSKSTSASTSTSPSRTATATASGSTTPGTSVPPPSAPTLNAGPASTSASTVNPTSASTVKPRPVPVPKPKATQRRGEGAVEGRESVESASKASVSHFSSAASAPSSSKLDTTGRSSKLDTCRSSKPSTSTSTPKTAPSASNSRSHGNEGGKGEKKKKKKKAEPYKKHPAHWYLDGSVLVQVDGVRYKLHRSRLVRISSFFKDLLESEHEGKRELGSEHKGKRGLESEHKGKRNTDRTQGDKKTGKEVEYEGGLPLVRLDGVLDGRDWEALVGALDGVVSYIHTPPPPRTLASILRASHALGVKEFERWAGRAFGDVWSDKLTALSSADAPSSKRENEESKDTKAKGKATLVGSEGGEKGNEKEKEKTKRRRGRLGVSATEAVITGRLCGLAGVVKRGMWELGKSETFEQGSDGEGDEGSWASDSEVGVDGDEEMGGEGESGDEDDGMGGEGVDGSDEGENGGEGSDDAMSVIVIDSDIEMITPSSSRRRSTKSGPTTKSSRTAKRRVSQALEPKAAKRNTTTITRREKRTWTLPAKDFTRLTLARSRLVAVWMRESVQFPEELLRVGCLGAIANRQCHPSESVSHGDEAEQEGDDAGGGVGAGAGGGGDREQDDSGENWYTCTATDASAAREAHRRLVVQSGVQGAWVNDVMGGLEVLGGLRWGWSAPSSLPSSCKDKRGGGKGNQKEGGREWSAGKKDECGGGGRGEKARNDNEGDEEEVYYGEFCDACVERMRDRWERVRREVWEECEGLFGIRRD